MEDKNKVKWLEEKKAALEGRTTEKNSPPKNAILIPKQEKKSHTGVSGIPKKGGGGGKGTWGKGGIDDLHEVVPDPKDPNYDSDEEAEIILRPPVITISPIITILEEYYNSGETQEVVKSLQELDSLSDSIQKEFVRRAITLAIEKQPYERELTSRLLSSLSNSALKPEKVMEGFQAVLDLLSDIVLDNPDATEVLAKFLARGVSDEILPPVFLKNAFAENSRAKEVLALAHGLTTEPHRLDRLKHIWGPADLSSVKRLKEEVDLLLNEYLATGDKEEADKCLRKLNAPSFYFQLVNRAVRLGIQKSPEERKKISALLKFFSETGLISSDHMMKGFRYVHESIKDISLDVPNATSILQEFEDSARQEKYL